MKTAEIAKIANEVQSVIVDEVYNKIELLVKEFRELNSAGLDPAGESIGCISTFNGEFLKGIELGMRRIQNVLADFDFLLKIEAILEKPDPQERG